MKIYDYIIIGSGLTGSAIAAEISQETKNILVLESEPFWGGANRPAKLQNQIVENGLRFIPATDLAKKTMKQLEDFLGIKLIRCEKENHVKTYEASGFKSFVGFGENPPHFYEQISYFLSPTELELTLPVHQILSLIQEKYQGEFLPRSYVTRFGFDEENNKLTHVVVNGTKTFFANNFIFTGNAKDLSVLMSDDHLNPRIKAKIKKEKTWLGICVDFLHQLPTETALKAMTETPSAASLESSKGNLFLLEGTTHDSVGPCIGRFTTENQISQWMGFIDNESAEDTEQIGEVLKKMKRQIKRAFPDLSENIVAERIFVTAPLSGVDLKLNSNGTLGKINNLWIASAHMSPYKNILGSLLQSQLTLAALGFGQFNTTSKNETTLNLEIIEDDMGPNASLTESRSAADSTPDSTPDSAADSAADL